MTDAAEGGPMPTVLPAGRRAGVCLHLTSLPGPYGIGEIGARARRFIDFMAAAGLDVWQFLPTGPTGYGDSPYQALSSFAGNEMLIDIDELLRAGLLRENEVTELRDLTSGSVDFGRLKPVKYGLLDRAAARFAERAPARMKLERDEFLHRHDRQWLHDYALFRLLKSRYGESPWPDWERDFVHREPQALRQFQRGATARLERVKNIQFLFDHQWRKLRRHAAECGVRLFGDMPFGIALDSADAWSRPEMLRIDRDGRPERVAGVPPDYFSRDGQLWGQPLHDWGHHRAQGYGWWIERLRRATGEADIVRIDHFRGFESYWSVAAGETTARNGRWEPGPGDAIFAAMRHALGRLPIVAEDLGVITPAVRRLRERHGFPGMRVLQFELADERFAIGDIPRNCVCYTGTHDNDTAVGWFHGSRYDRRSAGEIRRMQRRVIEITNGSPETIHTDLIRLAFASDAGLAAAPLQDYLGLGSRARFNTPGTARDNWRWRVRDAAFDAALRDRIGELITSTRRGA